VLAGYSYCKDPDNAATIVDDDVLIGDNTVICRIQEMQPSGRNRVWYRIEFIRRNVFHAVYGWGWETEVTPEFVQAVAMTLLEKVEEAPLSDEVTFRP
jgi:hypothetical protein